MSDISNRARFKKATPSALAKVQVLYRGSEGVVLAAHDRETWSAWAQEKVEGYTGLKISAETPGIIYLPFNGNINFSKRGVGHCRISEVELKSAQPLIDAAFASSVKLSRFLMQHGGLSTIEIPESAWQDPECCRMAVAAFSPRIQYVPEEHLTPDMCVTALSDPEAHDDIESNIFPVHVLAREEFAKAVFAPENRYKSNVIDALKAVFARKPETFGATLRALQPA